MQRFSADSYDVILVIQSVAVCLFVCLFVCLCGCVSEFLEGTNTTVQVKIKGKGSKYEVLKKQGREVKE